MAKLQNTTPSGKDIKEEALNELREVLLGVASQIVVTTGHDALAEEYLGISLDDFSLGNIPEGYLKKLESIDLDRFWIAKQIKAACSFALQSGTDHERMAFDENHWADLEIFLAGAPRISFGGEATPLANEDSMLRRTLEMALARMLLQNHFGLNIRQLSLLAGIGETAVRTSLSSEGIKTEGKPAQVPAEVAEPWLLRRRGFVPTLRLEDLDSEKLGPDEIFEDSATVAEQIAALCSRQRLDLEALSGQAKVDPAWLEGLMKGEQIASDVEALCRIAATLDVDVPQFVGRMIEAILVRNQQC